LKKQESATGDDLQRRMDAVVRENDSTKLELEVKHLFSFLVIHGSCGKN
jgi:hypothetical protein